MQRLDEWGVDEFKGDEAKQANENGDRRFFGYVEVVFDVAYLCAALFAGIYMLSRGGGSLHLLGGSMALMLAGGDAFHLLPRIGMVLTGDAPRFRRALGLGKLITSVTMTLFYVLLWHVGCISFPGVAAAWTVLMYVLAASRIALCLFPQNRWFDAEPPLTWAIARNIPFVLQGMGVKILYWSNRGAIPALGGMWLAVALSFAFYIPVVLWVHRHPKLGMLMLPKTCMYLWMLWMLVMM